MVWSVVFLVVYTRNLKIPSDRIGGLIALRYSYILTCETKKRLYMSMNVSKKSLMIQLNM